MGRLGLLLLLLTASWLSDGQASSVHAAACVIRYQDQLLLVQDRLSSRFSLSGGYIDGGERAEQAALRELYEETGLRGKVLFSLGHWHNAEIFACQTLSPMVVQRATGFLSLLDAPNLGGEILSAKLQQPAQLAMAAQRFPSQLTWLQTHIAKVPASEVRWQDDFIAQGMAIHQREIPWLRALQQVLAGQDWLAITNALGANAVQFALLLFLLPWLGWPRTLQLVWLMLWLGLLVQGAKEGLAWPRPFHLDPSLAKQAASGFGMPSGHSASALLFCAALLRWLWPQHPWRSAWLALTLASLTGLARLVLGVHFISDVLAGLAMAAIVLALRRYWHYLSAPVSGWLLALLGVGLGAVLQSPYLSAMGCIAIGLSLGLRQAMVREGYDCGLMVMLQSVFILLAAALWWRALPMLIEGSLSLISARLLLSLLFGYWLANGFWRILGFCSSWLGRGGKQQ